MDKSNFEKMKKMRWLYLCIAIILLLFLGLSYGWSVFRGPLEEEFGWSKPQTSMTFTLSIVFFCIGGLCSGFITGRRGPRTTMLISAVCIAIGFTGASRVDTIMGIHLAYGVLFGTGCGMCYNAVLSTVVRWFPEKQGTVSGLTLFGYGSGALVFGTAAAKIITDFGWRTAFLCFAVAFPLIVVIGSIVIKAPFQAFIDEMIGGEAGKIKPSVEELTPAAMIRRKNFWLFFFAEICFAGSGFAVINESTPFALEVLGDNLTRAAAIAGIVSISNGIGRILSGLMFDGLGYKKTMLIICAGFAASSGLLMMTLGSGSVTLLIASYIMIGLTYGGSVPLNSAYAAYFFGRKNYGINYSVLNMNPIFGAILGPTIGGGVFGRTFIMVAIFACIALAMTILIKLPISTEEDHLP